MGWVLLLLALGLVLYLRSLNRRRGLKPGEFFPSKEPFGVVIDVETTGLLNDTRPTKKKILESPDDFPRIVQISWLLLSQDYKPIALKTSFIRQNEPIPAEAIAIHGITNEECEAKGKDLKEVMQAFSKDIEPCSYFIGHNVQFDKNVIEAECFKAGLMPPFKYMKPLDTMLLGRKIMKRERFKLQSIAEHLFGKKTINQYALHNSEADVWITANIFVYLHRNSTKKWEKPKE